MRALILRERLADNYDPAPKFGWIVEMDSWFGLRTSDLDWMKANFVHDDYTVLGRRVIGFVKRDDALMFYLRYA